MHNSKAAQGTTLEGKALPPLKGEYLSGRKANLPADAKGRIALLLFGFSYPSRLQVDEWAAHWEKEYSSDASLAVYEIPMIGGIERLGRFFINRGMRHGTPHEKHENVITVYGGTGPWKKLLQVTDTKLAYAILVDQQGVVRWSHRGLYSEAAFNQLSEVVRNLLR